jgi:hypothetical protein
VDEVVSVDRKAVMLEMLVTGATLQEVADFFGLTKQRVSQIVGPDPEGKRRTTSRQKHREHRYVEFKLTHSNEVLEARRSGHSIARIAYGRHLPYDFVRRVIADAGLPSNWTGGAGK